MANWYADAVGGLDTNPGSALLPFKTAQKCADTAVAGDKVYGTGEEILTAIIDFDTNTGSVANGRIEYIACNSAFLPTKWGWIWNANGAVASIIKTYINIDYLLFNGIHLKSSTSHAVVNAANNYSYGNDFYQCKFELIGGQVFATFYQQAYSIRSCYFVNIIGLICNGLYYGKFTNNTIINCSAAIAFIDTYSTLFAGNVFHNCKTAVSITNQIQAHFFRYNVFNLCDIGIDCIILKGGYVSIDENRFTNCGIGIRTNAANEWCHENNNYFANNTTDLSQDAGRIISGGDSIFGGTVDGYVDAAALNFALKPDAIMRRDYRASEDRYITAGIPGADVYTQDFYLDKSVVSVTAGTVITVTLKHLAATLMTGLTLKGIACTDRTVTGANKLTFVSPDLTAGIGDIEGIITGYDNFVITNGITAQAGASAPGAVTVTGYATGKYANLSWTMAATSVTYDIEIDGVVYTGYTSLSAEIAMPRANTEYSFRVRGVNTVGNGAWSTAITVKTEVVADDETIALAGTAVLGSVEDLTGTLHIAQGMTGAKIFDPIILPSAISQETFEYYVKDVLYNQGRNVL